LSRMWFTVGIGFKVKPKCELGAESYRTLFYDFNEVG